MMSGTASVSRRAMVLGGASLAGSLLIGPFDRVLAAAPSGAAALRPTVVRNLAGPDGRLIPVHEWRPTGRAKGVILFSHGAASSPRFYDALIADWVASGHRVLAPLHVDSLVHPRTAEFPGRTSWKARIEDMRALIADIGSAPYVAAGHSYGGLVALTLGGARPILPEGMAGPVAPRLARAVIAFSPPAPMPVLITRDGYAALEVPAFVQTGTKDILPGAGADPDAWKGHLVPFEAAAPGRDRYGLVLEGVDHYFGGAICRYDLPGPRQLEGLAQARELAGLFLAGWGQGRRSARRALDARLTDQLPVRLLRR